MRKLVLLNNVAEEMTRSAVPVFLTVSFLSLRLPTFTSPNAIVDEDGDRVMTGAPVATPVPERMTDFVCGMSSASSAMVPLLLPAEVGLKVTVTVFDEPAATLIEAWLKEYCPDPVPTVMLVT